MARKATVAQIRKAITETIACIDPPEKQELAKRAKTSAPNISKILKTGSVTAELAVKFEHISGGKVSRARFRPDLFA